MTRPAFVICIVRSPRLKRSAFIGAMVVGLGLLFSPSLASALPAFIDDFSVVKNSALFFQDPFADGVPPPSAPNFPNGSPASYFVNGTLNETGGKVRLDTAGAASSPGIGGPGTFLFEQALLLTNIDAANLELGLKSDDTFSVTGIFDLTVPTVNHEYYGLRLADFATAKLGNDILELAVRRTSTGLDLVQFFRLDQIANTFTSIGAAFLEPGHDQISLTLARPNTANNEITASFFYIDGGLAGPTTTFSSADIFNGENFTRAAFLAVTPVPAPEPGTLILLGTGLAGLVACAVRRHSK
jgi:hypothetical protein